MIHHLSMPADCPAHVAQVLAELWHGQVIPFPVHAGSYAVLAMDDRGTMIEVYPQGTELRPGTAANQVQFDQNPAATRHMATHAALSVAVGEAQIMAIAAREGWRAVRCNRDDCFEVIEFWLENRVLLELMPPELASQYLAFMQPVALQQVLATMIKAEAEAGCENLPIPNP